MKIIETFFFFFSGGRTGSGAGEEEKNGATERYWNCRRQLFLRFFRKSGQELLCSTVGVRPPAAAHTMAALHRRPIQWEFLYKAVSRNYRIIAAAGGRITQMSSYFIIVEIPFY